MAFLIELPRPPDGRAARARLDIVDGVSTLVQRALRADGLAGYEPPTMACLLALMHQQGDQFTFFDVGANAGIYAELAATLFRPACVVAFEPTPRTARAARRIAHRNRSGVLVEEMALGERDGQAELYLSARSDASNSLVAGFKRATGAITVPVRTLDGYVRASGRVPTLVKIDTETYEPQVLAGALGTIRRHRPTMVVEVLHRRGHDHGEDLMAVIADLGYHYYRLDASGAFTPAPRVTGDPTSPWHDWLLAPSEVDDRFAGVVSSWAAAVAECTADRHRASFTGRLPAMRHAARARLGRRVASLRSRGRAG